MKTNAPTWPCCTMKSAIFQLYQAVRPSLLSSKAAGSATASTLPKSSRRKGMNTRSEPRWNTVASRLNSTFNTP